MSEAFDNWTTEQRAEVKVFIESLPGKTDSEVVTYLYQQRAIGFWGYAKSEDLSVNDQANQQLLIDIIIENGIVATDKRPAMANKLAEAVRVAGTNEIKIDLLSRHSCLWVLMEEYGFISNINTSNSIRVTPKVVSDDIAQTRLT